MEKDNNCIGDSKVVKKEEGEKMETSAAVPPPPSAAASANGTSAKGELQQRRAFNFQLTLNKLKFDFFHSKINEKKKSEATTYDTTFLTTKKKKLN